MGSFVLCTLAFLLGIGQFAGFPDVPPADAIGFPGIYSIALVTSLDGSFHAPGMGNKLQRWIGLRNDKVHFPTGVVPWAVGKP